MELSQLVQFITVAKYLNMRQAAEELYMAQPNISRAIKNLEEELGVALFERQKKRLFLTDVGKEALELCNEIIEKTEQLKALGEKSNKYDISIAGLGVVYFNIMIPRMNSLRNRYNIYAHTLSNKEQMYQALHTGKYDVLIVDFDEKYFNDERLTYVKFFTENLCVSMPVKNSLSKNRTVTLDELKNEKFILSTHEEANRSNTMLHSKGIPVKTEYITDSPVSGNQFIGSDGLVFDSILNKYYGMPSKERKLIPIADDSAKYDVFMVYKKDNEEKLLPIINWILNFCKGI